MQFLARDADFFRQARFDVHVNVFERHRPAEPILGNFILGLLQPLDDPIGAQQQAKAGQVGGAQQNAEIRLPPQLANDVLILYGVVAAILRSGKVRLVG